jgi:hypothetical protein
VRDHDFDYSIICLGANERDDSVNFELFDNIIITFNNSVSQLNDKSDKGEDHAMIFEVAVLFFMIRWSFRRIPSRQRKRMAKYIRRGLGQGLEFENLSGYLDYRNGVLAACANGFALSGIVRSASRANDLFRSRFPQYGSGDACYARDQYLFFFTNCLGVSKRLVAYIDRLHVRGVPALSIADILDGKVRRT